MSVRQINSADYDYEMFLETLNKSYKGKADITISNYDNTGVPEVQVGSVFEDNGAIFIVDTSEIEPTGYGGISNSTTFYLYYDEDPGAFIYSTTPPTWSDVLQGWYNSNDRAFFSMYKDSGGTLYQNKWLIGKERELYYRKLITSANILEGSLTENVSFDKLAPFIPNTNDIMLISGCLYLSNIFYVFSHATRTAGNTIQLSGYNFSIETGFPNSNAGYTLTDGDETTITIELAW